MLDAQERSADIHSIYSAYIMYIRCMYLGAKKRFFHFLIFPQHLFIVSGPVFLSLPGPLFIVSGTVFWSLLGPFFDLCLALFLSFPGPFFIVSETTGLSFPGPLTDRFRDDVRIVSGPFAYRFRTVSRMLILFCSFPDFFCVSFPETICFRIRIDFFWRFRERFWTVFVLFPGSFFYGFRYCLPEHFCLFFPGPFPDHFRKNGAWEKMGKYLFAIACMYIVDTVCILCIPYQGGAVLWLLLRYIL